MNDKIKTISIAVIAGILLISAGGYMAYKYFTLQSTVNQIATFLNQQIQKSQEVNSK